MGRAGAGSRQARPDPHPLHTEPSEPPTWLLVLGAIGLVAVAYGVCWAFPIIAAWPAGVGR